MPNGGDITLRELINTQILESFREMDPLRYRLGAKSGRDGTIDCSGFIGQIFDDLANRIPELPSLRDLIQLNSEGQYTEIANAVGGTGRVGIEYLRYSFEAGRIQPGMIISMDTGSTRSGFDSNRSLGIDHIFMTARNDQGRLIIVESNGHAGVTQTDFETWMNRQNSNRTFFVTDAVRYALTTAAGNLTFNSPLSGTFTLAANFVNSSTIKQGQEFLNDLVDAPLATITDLATSGAVALADLGQEGLDIARDTLNDGIEAASNIATTVRSWLPPSP